MRAALAVPPSPKNQLTLPVAALLACLIAIVSAVQWPARPVQLQAPEPPAATESARERLASELVKDASKLEGVREEKAAALRKAVAELDSLLAILGKTGENPRQTASLAQIFRSVAGMETELALMIAENRGAERSRLSENADAFHAAIASYRERATLPRERSFADDLEQRFATFTGLQNEIGAFQQLRSAHVQKIGEYLKTGPEGVELVDSDHASTLIVRDGASRFSPEMNRWFLTGLASVGIGLGILVAVQANRRIERPVQHLVEVARAITNGRARRRASPEQAGDFAILAHALNQMVEAKQHAEERMQAAHDSLELKVSARTAELWRANKALREESEQRARAERDFLQAQKMDALGKLAGSIAHDFNNLLTVIIGGAECTRKQLGDHHPATAMLRTVEQAGERAAGLTRPLLTFSRNQVLSVDAINLNEAAQEAGRMLNRLLGVNIDLRLDLAPDLRPFKANGNQVQQVLINLGVNARDAMEGTGALTITTRNASVAADVAASHGVHSKDEWVKVSVQDTGCGMDAATKVRIFEPFFTTKPAGKGTGLGLATVFGIVKQCGGFLEVESSPGEGTVFHVFFPATEPEQVVEKPPTPPPAPLAATGGETLLLVDDEEDIRELATITLESYGYRILSAGNAEEAIQVAEQHTGEIRALITDVVMPGMTGVQLAEILSSVIPGLRVLFVSGHSNESISEETLLTAHADYLQKPYLGDALAAKVRDVLAGGEAHLPEPAIEHYTPWVS